MLRFLAALLVALVLLVLLVLRVTSSGPERAAPADAVAEGPVPPAPPEAVETTCQAFGWAPAARGNAQSLRTLQWAPFGRPEVGWETYAPLIQKEIDTVCGPTTEAFAEAFAAWQGDQRLLPDGIMSEKDFTRLKSEIQLARPIVRLSAKGVCPEPAEAVAAARTDEGYSGKKIWLRPAVLAAYRRMVAAAKAEVPEIARDPRNLTIFSGYRSPQHDAARCARDGNCNGIVRARCSPHRTGLALDLYVGQAPGHPPDSTADPNRRFMTQTATYRWLVENAHRFGFVNYPFEPWHWEWTGEAPEAPG